MTDTPFSPVVDSGDIYELVYFPRDEWVKDLALVALPEKWENDESGSPKILFNYFRYYTRRIIEERLWVETVTSDGVHLSAFDTGLLTRKHYEPIYAVFEANRDPSRDQPWKHKEWATLSSRRMRAFDGYSLGRALFFSNPAEVVFDPRLKVVPNLEHIVTENVDRFPDVLKENEYLRKGALEQAIATAAAKTRSNWRLAAPQFYWPGYGGPGRVQLLLPLCLLRPEKADLALVLDRTPSYSEDPSSNSACYSAYTVLTLMMAYQNARLITRPEAYWLDINTQTGN